MEDVKKIETGDSAEVEAKDSAEETPEVAAPKKKVAKKKATKKKVAKKKVAKKAPTKEEKPKKPERKMPEKAKSPDKASDAGKAWWKSQGSVMTRRGHSQRNIILKASRDAGKTFQQAMVAMRIKGSVQEKAESLFD